MKRRSWVIPAPETRLACSVADYLRIVLPRTAIWWHTPNEGKRGRAEAGIAARMGLHPGVPDLTIIWLTRAHFVELKAARGKLSPAQEAFATACLVAQVPWALCRSVAEVEAQLLAWDIPLRGRLQ